MILNTKLEKYMTVSSKPSFIFIVIILFLLNPLQVICTGTNYANVLSKPAQSQSGHEPYVNRIFDPTIQTMLLYTTVSELDPPIIQLHGNEKIVLNFDDLGEDVRDMYYRFEHCTHDWKPSGLHQMDFQNGYNTDYIADYQYSFNTIQPYTHYKLEFPNDRIQLTKSGNYVIKVRSEERRVGKECKSRWSQNNEKKKK